MASKNPLAEIIDAALRQQENLLDQEWPAQDSPLLAVPDRTEARIEKELLRPLGSFRGRN